MSDDVTLLPCPFCGSKPLLLGLKAPEFWVSCPKIGCKAGTEAFGGKNKAIAVWNRRVTPAPDSEKLRDALVEARNAPMIDHSGQKRGVYDVLDRLIAATPSPDSGERMREARPAEKGSFTPNSAPNSDQRVRARFLVRKAFNEWDGSGSFHDLIADSMVDFALQESAR